MFMTKNRLPLVAVTLIFVLGACNFPGGTSAEEKAAAVQTSAAETVNAQLTQNAELTPSSTPTPEATDTPEATNTPLASNTPEATSTSETTCDSILFVSDVTVPDGTDFSPGETFTKTWRLRNVGTCTWTTDYDLVFDSGNSMSGPAAQALTGSVAPGQEVDISVDLTAPASDGNYVGNWKLRNSSGVVFGLPGPFYVEIDVVSGGGGGSGDDTVTIAASAVGSVRSNGDTNPNPNTGDTGGDLGSQAFVSFDLSSIPDGATIDEVRVDFSDYDTLSNPFSGLGCLRGYTGSFFPLDASDYFAGSPGGAVLRWCDTGELDSPHLDDDVKDAVQAALASDVLELRLQFSDTATDGDGTADMVRFGAVSLEITYTAP